MPEVARKTKKNFKNPENLSYSGQIHLGNVTKGNHSTAQSNYFPKLFCESVFLY